MEFTIDRKKFTEAIQQVIGIIDRKSTMQILQNLLIQTVSEGDGIEILSTNLEIGIRVNIDAGVKKDGKLTIPAKKLLELVRELQGDTINFTSKGKGAVIYSDKIIARINGMAADDYPEIIKSAGYETLSISPVLLKDMLKKVSYAVNKEGSPRNLSGIFIQKIIDDGKTFIIMAATDGKRLATVRAERNNDDPPLPEKGVIVPGNGFAELRKISENIEEDIGIGFVKGALIAESEKVTLRINLIDDNYPDINKVIPDTTTEGTIAVLVSRDSFLHSLRRMAVYSQACVLNINGDTIKLEANDPELGEIRDEIEAEIPEGTERTVKYNVKYLIDAIEAVSEEYILLHIPEGLRGCLIRPAADVNYKAVVMPLKD